MLHKELMNTLFPEDGEGHCFNTPTLKICLCNSSFSDTILVGSVVDKLEVLLSVMSFCLCWGQSSWNASLSTSLILLEA